jgi:hypothetical protein
MLNINKFRAVKQLVIWPIFFVLGGGVAIAGGALYVRDPKWWPIYLSMMVTGGFIAAASLLIIAIYAARLVRTNRKLDACRGLACIDIADDIDLAIQPTGLALTF